MQKKLTVLFAFAIFVLVVGLHTDSYAFNQNNPKPHKGKGEVLSRIDFIVSEPISGDSCVNINIGGGTRNLADPLLRLTTTFFQDVISGGPTCFSPFAYGYWQMVLQKKDGSVRASFYISANDTITEDPEKVIQYQLNMKGGKIIGQCDDLALPGNWPPEDEECTLVRFEEWSMDTSGPAVGACTGGEMFPQVVEVAVLRDDNDDTCDLTAP